MIFHFTEPVLRALKKTSPAWKTGWHTFSSYAVTVSRDATLYVLVDDRYFSSFEISFSNPIASASM